MITLNENQHLAYCMLIDKHLICYILQHSHRYTYLLMIFLLHIETYYNKRLHRCNDILSYT